jgi:hypothetical protein
MNESLMKTDVADEYPVTFIGATRWQLQGYFGPAANGTRTRPASGRALFLDHRDPQAAARLGASRIHN